MVSNTSRNSSVVNLSSDLISLPPTRAPQPITSMKNDYHTFSPLLLVLILSVGQFFLLLLLIIWLCVRTRSLSVHVSCPSPDEPEGPMDKF